MVCTDADRSSKLKRMCQNSRRDFLPGVSHLGITLKNRMGHVASRREARRVVGITPNERRWGLLRQTKP